MLPCQCGCAKKKNYLLLPTVLGCVCVCVCLSVAIATGVSTETVSLVCGALMFEIPAFINFNLVFFSPRSQ